MVTLAECLGGVPAYQSVGAPGTPDVSALQVIACLGDLILLSGILDVLDAFWRPRDLQTDGAFVWTFDKLEHFQTNISLDLRDNGHF
jgi:hypothetical protein